MTLVRWCHESSWWSWSRWSWSASFKCSVVAVQNGRLVEKRYWCSFAGATEGVRAIERWASWFTDDCSNWQFGTCKIRAWGYEKEEVLSWGTGIVAEDGCRQEGILVWRWKEVHRIKKFSYGVKRLDWKIEVVWEIFRNRPRGGSVVEKENDMTGYEESEFRQGFCWGSEGVRGNLGTFECRTRPS